jgi:hypothetical protein
MRSELAVWGEGGGAARGVNLAKVQLHPNANKTEANRLAALRRHGESSAKP